MARNRTRDSITLTGKSADDFVKGIMATEAARSDVDTSNGQDGGETHEPDGPPHLDTEEVKDAAPETDLVPDSHRPSPVVVVVDGITFLTTPERTGADIIADLLAVKVRLECERARWEGIEADAKKAWDALADELGKRAKTQHLTRVPVRIGGTVYGLKFTKAAATYTLLEARTPGEIK